MSTGKMLTEKNMIPTKSRLAAWWMLILGGIAGAIGLALLLGAFSGVAPQDELGGFFIFIFGMLGIAIFVVYFIPGLLILKGGRWGWIIASAILSLAAAWSFSPLIFQHSSAPYSLIPLLSLLIPLILILLDHISYKLVSLLVILVVILYFVSHIIPII